jgi:hypothetical protein
MNLFIYLTKEISVLMVPVSIGVLIDFLGSVLVDIWNMDCNCFKDFNVPLVVKALLVRNMSEIVQFERTRTSFLNF